MIRSECAQPGKRAAHSRDSELAEQRRRSTAGKTVSCTSRKGALMLRAIDDRGRARWPTMIIDFEGDGRIRLIIGCLLALVFVRLRHAEAAKREVLRKLICADTFKAPRAIT